MKEDLEALRQVVAPRYSITREIGRGGMATVYLAEDRQQNELVALKVLRRELTLLVGADRFLQEIEILTRLRHPNILPLLDSRQAGAVLYYVMPFVAGASLRTLLDQEGPLSVERALSIARDLASALDYAHAHGVIHRDVKPGNVLLDRHRAVVCDFGVARALIQSSREPISSSGLVLGTAPYMSPEQAMGYDELDARTDLYALGCVVYEMLTGEQPFTGPTPQAIMARQLSEAPRPIRTVRPEVSPEIEHAVLAALARSPEDRPPTGAHLVRMLGTRP